MALFEVNEVSYSEKYFDDVYEYRNIILPKKVIEHIPVTHLMTETEWRNLGVQQSPDWVHYMIHTPEPHILMFRRPKPVDEDAATKSKKQGSSSTTQRA